MFLPSNARGWIVSSLFDETESYKLKTVLVKALLQIFCPIFRSNFPSRAEEHSSTEYW